MSSTNSCLLLFSFFFFNDTATTEIYTLSLHDALPICGRWPSPHHPRTPRRLSMHRSQHRGEWGVVPHGAFRKDGSHRSEEHTSELQSRLHLVCRLLLEKKKTKIETNELHNDQAMTERV